MEPENHIKAHARWVFKVYTTVGSFLCSCTGTIAFLCCNSCLRRLTVCQVDRAETRAASDKLHARHTIFYHGSPFGPLLQAHRFCGIADPCPTDPVLPHNSSRQCHGNLWGPRRWHATAANFLGYDRLLTCLTFHGSHMAAQLYCQILALDAAFDGYVDQQEEPWRWNEYCARLAYFICRGSGRGNQRLCKYESKGATISQGKDDRVATIAAIQSARCRAWQWCQLH